MAKFLNLTGLQYFWSKVKGHLDTKVDKTTKINGKDLTTDVTLTAADVGAVDLTAVGAASGVASLDENGKVLASQLPSFVDDVLEFDTRDAFPETGESGKIYVALDSGITYRWGGTTYVEISSSLAIGETETTAGRGDWTKAAYDHSLTEHAPTTAATQEAIGLMSKEDKIKLDGIEEGANKYVLPVAAAELGGVKTTSEVTDVTGYSAAPIVGGVVYYKDQVDPEVISNDDIDAIFTE